nr:MAG TPA: hypothetical protein [Caudoviricetes sp.]
MVSRCALGLHAYLCRVRAAFPEETRFKGRAT